MFGTVSGQVDVLHQKHLVMIVWLKKKLWFFPHFDVGENLILGLCETQIITKYRSYMYVTYDVQKKEERRHSFCAMGKGPFDCASGCMVDNITCAINEHYEDTWSVVICKKKTMFKRLNIGTTKYRDLPWYKNSGVFLVYLQALAKHGPFRLLIAVYITYCLPNVVLHIYL